jgi:hypothetical protein
VQLDDAISAFIWERAREPRFELVAQRPRQPEQGQAREHEDEKFCAPRHRAIITPSRGAATRSLRLR